MSLKHMEIYIIPTALAISPVTEKIWELSGTLISLNCFPETLIIRICRQATEDQHAKIEPALIALIVCASARLIICSFTLICCKNFIIFYKTFIKLLIKQLLVCFGLKENLRKKKSKKKIGYIYIQFGASIWCFLPVFAGKGNIAIDTLNSTENSIVLTK